MAKPEVVHESFGTEIVQPTVSRGKIEAFGHMADDRKFDARPTFSVNQKTGAIQKSAKK